MQREVCAGLGNCWLGLAANELATNIQLLDTSMFLQLKKLPQFAALVHFGRIRQLEL